MGKDVCVKQDCMTCWCAYNLDSVGRRRSCFSRDTCGVLAMHQTPRGATVNVGVFQMLVCTGAAHKCGGPDIAVAWEAVPVDVTIGVPWGHI